MSDDFDPAIFKIELNVHFRIDLAGNATITDRKTVKNLTDQVRSLPGPFKQTIRRTAANISGKDSDGNNLTVMSLPDINSDELVLNFNTPSGCFTIPPGSTRWFEIQYTVYSFAQPVGDVLFFQTRIANRKYSFPIHFANSVRLKVKQHQLVGGWWCNGSGGIWLQGA